MNIEIKDKKSLVHISQGDLLVDSMSQDGEVYLVNFDSFVENEMLFKLIPLSGSNKSFDDRGFYESEIKQYILGNRLVHYSKDDYKLSLTLKEEV